MNPWRIVFMGTPEFAVPALSALITGPDRVVGVFTQPDKPAGRGMKLTPPPVKELAEKQGIPLFQPRRMRDPEALEMLRGLDADLAVVAAYGQILPKEILETPRFGCLNIHASLLPRWRGAAPIHRAVMAGDAVSGVTLMQMDEGLDTGAMLGTRERPLDDAITTGELHDCLSRLGAGLMREVIAELKEGRIQPRPQPAEGATYAKKITEAERRIDWRLEAVEVNRLVRGLHPFPSAYALRGEEPLKVLACRPACRSHDGTPGEVLALHDDGPEIACGAGGVILTEVQAAGKRRMAAGEWMRGQRLKPGDRLG
ncbi:MAG: methionyl-tRNA formyltransferase [Magnetococcales bacterium]|nr:methionyl-tRNA formyltransferase [Magnetococcales bacterium]